MAWSSLPLLEALDIVRQSPALCVDSEQYAPAPEVRASRLGSGVDRGKVIPKLLGFALTRH
jgi:hypothetical protein